MGTTKGVPGNESDLGPSSSDMNRWLFTILFLLGISDCNARMVITHSSLFKGIDTVFAGAVLPNAGLIKSGHSRYTMLIYGHQAYNSIKFLDQHVLVYGDRIQVVEKLYNGTFTNADS